jgi:hypothetical protein
MDVRISRVEEVHPEAVALIASSVLDWLDELGAHIGLDEIPGLAMMDYEQIGRAFVVHVHDNLGDRI